MRSMEVPSSPPSHRWLPSSTTAEKLSRILASSFLGIEDSSRRIGELRGTSAMTTPLLFPATISDTSRSHRAPVVTTSYEGTNTGLIVPGGRPSLQHRHIFERVALSVGRARL